MVWFSSMRGTVLFWKMLVGAGEGRGGAGVAGKGVGKAGESGVLGKGVGEAGESGVQGKGVGRLVSLVC